MREVRARVAAALLLVALLLGTVLLGEVVEPALVAGVLGALLCAFAARPVRAGPAVVPAVAARARRRALARRGTPAQRDPDAAGRTRSRAPSGLLPAV